MMKEAVCEGFQRTVSETLLFNRSVLEVLAKTHEATARLNRAVIKTVTSCGCLKINAGKKEIPPEATLADLRHLLESHLVGELCEDCREVVENAIGRSLFYLTALCNLLNLSLKDIMEKEQRYLRILGIYNLA